MAVGRVVWLGVVIAVALMAMALHYSMSVPGRSFAGSPPALTADEAALSTRLAGHVAAIASEPHNIAHYAALERSARYIETTLSQLGYAVERHEFSVDGRTVRNIEVVIEPSVRPAGAGTLATARTLVVGAHYDSAGVAPGANDNGTGTAAVIELARLLKGLRSPAMRLRLVAFVNEEPPYFQTENMGSWRYAKRLSERGEKVLGMLSLETLGAFSHQPGSQSYPFPMGLFYPHTADFIAFVAMPGSRSFLHQVLGSFRAHAKVPSVGGVSLDIIPGIGWSDHWSFAQFGFPAVMVTDTAVFRYPHYHLKTDTADKVDFSMLARITKGIEQVVREIAAKSG